MDIQISFPGGLRVDAQLDGQTVRTDQPAAHGGDGSAPSPFDHFLASLGTCAGFYALRFCRERGIATEGLSLRLHTMRDPERPRIATVEIDVELPQGFPEKYRRAVLRAIDQCSVKRHLLEPPRIEVAIAAPVPV